MNIRIGKWELRISVQRMAFRDIDPSRVPQPAEFDWTWQPWPGSAPLIGALGGLAPIDPPALTAEMLRSPAFAFDADGNTRLLNCGYSRPAGLRKLAHACARLLLRF